MKSALPLALAAALLALAAAWILWGGGAPAEEPRPAAVPEEGVRRPALERDEVELHPIFTEEVRGSAPAARASRDDAVLNLLVHTAETHRALEGIELRVVPEGGEAASFVTDELGWVVAAVRPGVPHTIETDAAPIVSGEVRVPALQPTQRRWVPIGLRTRADLAFFARVVAAEDDAPLPGATVEGVNTKTPGRERVGPDGMVQVTAAPWRNPHLVVGAEGRATYRVPVTAGHETAAAARKLALPLTATLRVFAVDVNTGPLAGVPVRAYVKGHDTLLGAQGVVTRFRLPDAVQEGVTDTWGMCELPGLHPNAPVHVEVRPPGRSAQAPPPIFLEPGATRQRDYVFGRGGAVAGHVVDQRGRPVPGLDLICHRGALETRPWFFTAYGARAECTTDPSGRFLFEGLTAGHWWVGPKPRAIHAAPAANGAAPIAARVTLETDDARGEVVLRVTRGLYIRGRVKVPEGVDVNEAQARCGAIEGWASGSTTWFEDGAFALGPLVAGSYWVDGHLDGFVGKRVRAEAGATGVVLEFVVGGAVSGRVVDGTSGEPVEATVFPYVDRPTGGWMEMRIGPEFDFQGLVPGGYTLVASTADERIGWARVEVESEREITGIEVTLRPAAVLELTHVSGGAGTLVHVFRGESRVGVQFVKPDRVEQVLVPGGALTVVELQPDLTEAGRREITTVAGRTFSLSVGR